MTMYVYGDSSIRPFKSLSDTWIRIISSKLNQDVKIYHKKDMVFDPIITTYRKEKINIKDNDIIIIILSSADINEVDQIKEFLDDLNFLSKEKNLKTIIFYSYDIIFDKINSINHRWENLYIVPRSIIELSISEFKEEFFQKHDLFYLRTNDIRVNHFIKTNHFILADKVVNYINNNVPINLYQDFVSNIIDHNSFKNPEFRKNELFNGVFEKAIKLKLSKRKVDTFVYKSKK